MDESCHPWEKFPNGGKEGGDPVRKVSREIYFQLVFLKRSDICKKYLRRGRLMFSPRWVKRKELETKVCGRDVDVRRAHHGPFHGKHGVGSWSSYIIPFGGEGWSQRKNGPTGSNLRKTSPSLMAQQILWKTYSLI